MNPQLILSQLLKRINLRLCKYDRLRPLDLRETEFNHPFLRSFYNKDIIVNLNLELGRTPSGSKLLDHSFDIVLNSLKYSLQNTSSLPTKDNFVNLFQSHLLSYKNLIDSNTLNNHFSINNHNFTNIPPLFYILPWDTTTFSPNNHSAFLEAYHKILRKQFKCSKKAKDIKELKEIYFTILLKKEPYYYYKLLSKLWSSYIFDIDNPIPSYILSDNVNYRWILDRDGNHRVRILSALNYVQIPLKITRIIRIQEVKYWPNVINKLFTEKEATHIFYNYFHGNKPEIYTINS